MNGVHGHLKLNAWYSVDNMAAVTDFERANESFKDGFKEGVLGYTIQHLGGTATAAQIATMLGWVRGEVNTRLNASKTFTSHVNEGGERVWSVTPGAPA